MHVSVFTTTKGLEEANHPTPAPLWDAAETDSGTPAMVLHPPLIEGSQSCDLVCRISICRGSELFDSRRLNQGLWYFLIRKIFQNWPLLTPQKI
jgi:hypothetical protein